LNLSTSRIHYNKYKIRMLRYYTHGPTNPLVRLSKGLRIGALSKIAAGTKSWEKKRKIY